MKKLILVLVVGLVIVNLVFDCFAGQISWQDIGGGNLKVKTVLVDPLNSRIIYMGCLKGIFRTEDGALNWRNVLSIHGENQAVNLLLFGPGDSNSIYAACGNGLYYSNNRGNNWRRIFKGKNSFENECTTVAILPSAIYLGTKGGLFVSSDAGRSWHKESSQFRNSHILAIASNIKRPDNIYIASVEGIFMKKSQKDSWERIFTALATENGDDLEESSEDLDEEKKTSQIRYISIDSNNPGYLYLATTRRVYKSKDGGKSWEPVSDYGLLSREVRFLIISPRSKVYVVTKSGIFEFESERWYELSLNLTAQANSLSFDSQNNLYAACDKGLFKAKENDSGGESKTNRIAAYSENEPKIKEVQQAAIKYAEVDLKKILRWRKQAAKKAFLPKVSANVGRNVTDLWHWETGSSTKVEDDVLNKGNDAIEWDVGLSWDLSEIIWNNDQTSIDTRSRLLVQLRDDILDEVTKLYFERIRVKMELDNLAIEDRKKRLEKELRLEELSASLDALTDGYFSANIRIIKSG